MGVRGHQGEKRVGVHPKNVGIKEPSVLEPGGFGLLGQTHDAFDRNVGLQRYSKLHGGLLSPL
jgi:hypothetical protein